MPKPLNAEERTVQMYRAMAACALSDFAAGIFEGWNGRLALYVRIAHQIEKLFAAGFRPTYHPLAGGFTWKVPDHFDAPWLYSDRSCGHYHPNPWEAARRCAESATACRITEA